MTKKGGGHSCIMQIKQQAGEQRSFDGRHFARSYSLGLPDMKQIATTLAASALT